MACLLRELLAQQSNLSVTCIAARCEEKPGYAVRLRARRRIEPVSSMVLIERGFRSRRKLRFFLGAYQDCRASSHCGQRMVFTGRKIEGQPAPQGLKPSASPEVDGAAEAAPFQNRTLSQPSAAEAAPFQNRRKGRVFPPPAGLPIGYRFRQSRIRRTPSANSAGGVIKLNTRYPSRGKS